MKTFDNFLQEQGGGLDDFLDQHGLTSDWENYKSSQNP